MVRCVLCMVALVSSAIGQQPDGVTTPYSDIRIFLTDGWGNPVFPATIELRPVGRWQESHAKILYPKEWTAKLPAGTYFVYADAQGFRRYCEIAEIPPGHSFLHLSLALSEIEHVDPDPLPRLRGRVVKELLTETPFWVRLVGIYTGMVKVAEVDSSGRFEIRGIMPGRHILFVFNKGHLRHSQFVDVRRYKEPEVTIRVTDKRPKEQK